MSSIDQRTVKMSFDNAAFERGVQTTLGTLEKLKQSLNFTGAAQGMDGIRDAASRISFESLAENVQSLQDRFSVLGEFVHNVFMDIVNSAFDAGKKLVDALALEPLKEGFREYELQMNSVQTIMASTGESVDVVNGYLDELNNYADKTIYSFSDMTQNIGKFTNAGVKLDDAVAAIQGVSNVAAVSGANANEASRAMYNFAQALSAGYVKLIDWKSIEVANMATVEFKQALLDTALAMGTVVKEGDDYISTTTNAKGEISEAFNATKNFNEMLQYQWMSTEVLTQTLQNYSTDVREMNDAEKQAYREKLRGLGYTEEQITKFEELGMKAADAAKDVKTFSQLIDTVKESLGSSWTRSWQLVIGDLEEAKKLWTRVNDIISGYVAKSAEARNATIKAWVDNGGRTAAIDGLIDAFEALVDRLRIIKNVFTNVFPPKTGEQIAEITKKFAAFTKGLRLSKNQTTLFQNQLQLVFSAVKPLITVFHNVIDTVVMFFKAISDSIKYDSEWVAILRNIVSAIYAFSNALKPTMAVVSYFNAIVKDIIGLVNDVAKGFAKFGTAVLTHVVQGFKELLPYSNEVATILSSLHTRLTTVRKTVNAFFDSIISNSNSSFNIVAIVSKAILDTGQAFVTFGKSIYSVVKSIVSGIKDALIVDKFVGYVSILSSAFRRLIEAFTPTEKMLTSIQHLFRGLTYTVQSIIGVIVKFGVALIDHLITPIGNNERKFNSLADIFNNIGQHLIELSHSIERVLTFSFFATFIDNISTSLKNFADAINGVFHFDKFIENFIKFFNTTDEHKESPSIIQGLANVLNKFSEALKSVSETIRDFATNVGDKLNLDKLGEVLGRFFGRVTKFLETTDLLKVATDLFGKLGDAVSSFMDKLKPSNMDPMAVINAILNVELFKRMYEVFNKIDKKLSDTIPESKSLLDILKESVTGVADTITKSLSSISKELTESLNAMQTTLNVHSLLKIAVAVGILTASLYVLSTLDMEKLLPPLAALSGLLFGLVKAVQALQNLNITSTMQMSTASTGMVKIAAALLILSIAIKRLADVDPERLTSAMLALSSIMKQLMGVVGSLQNTDKQISQGANALIKFAAAVVILVSAVKSLAKVNPDRLMPAMIALTAIMVELSTVAKKLSVIKDPKTITSVSTGLLVFVAAVRLLVSSVKSLAKMEPGDLMVAMLAVTLLITELGVVASKLSNSKVIQNPKLLVDVSKGLLVFVVAVRLLVSSVKSLANIDPTKLTTATIALAALVTILGVVASKLSNEKVISNPQLLSKVAAGLIVFVAAVKIMAGVVVDFGQIPIPELIASTAALAAIILVLVAAANKLSGMDLSGVNDAALGMMAFMGAVKTMGDVVAKLAVIPFDQLVAGLGGLIVVTAILIKVSDVLSSAALDPVQIASVSAALIVFSAAVGLLSLSVVAIGKLGIPGMIVGLIGIAGAIGIFAAAAVLLTPLIPQMAAFAAVMIEFGIALALVGVGVGVATLGIASLLATIAGTGFAVIEILRQLFGLLPELAVKLGEALAAFAKTLVEHGEEIKQAIGTMFDIVIQIIAERRMFAINLLLQSLTMFMESLAEYIPRITEAAIAIFKGFTDACTDHMNEITDSAFKLIVSFIDGLATAIDNNHDALWDAIGHLLESIAKAIWDGLCKLDEAANGLLDHVADALKDGWDRIYNAGVNLVQGFVDGITSIPGKIWDAGSNLVDQAWQAITGAAQEHSPSRLTFGGGVNFVLGFINGMKDQLGPTGTAAAQIAYTAWDALQNGMSPDVTFAPNIKPFMDLGFVDEMAKNVVDTASQAMYGAQEIIRSGLSTDMSFAPTITPVMDLSFIEQLKAWITDTASRVAYTAWTALQEGLSSDMNFAPTITPVMDLSDIQNGIVTAKDLMYSMPDTVGISASISNDKNLKRQMVDLMSSQNDYSSILAGMSDLRSELSSFGDKLAQMQIVMDSGALVGAIAQPMDQTLGMRQAMVGRGVL